MSELEGDAKGELISKESLWGICKANNFYLHKIFIIKNVNLLKRLILFFKEGF